MLACIELVEVLRAGFSLTRRRPLLFGSRALVVAVSDCRGLGRGAFVRFRSGWSLSVTHFGRFDLGLGLFLRACFLYWN